jgi:hypothetical protein
MSRLEDLEKQKKDYESLVGVLDNISLMKSSEFEVVNSISKEYKDKLEVIQRDIIKQEVYQKTLKKRYDIIRILLFVFSIFSIIVFYFMMRYQNSIFLILLLFFLFIQYIALFFLESISRKKKVYIFGFVLLFLPFVFAVVQHSYPNIFGATEWFSYAVGGISVYNLFVGIYDHLITVKIGKKLRQ